LRSPYIEYIDFSLEPGLDGECLNPSLYQYIEPAIAASTENSKIFACFEDLLASSGPVFSVVMTNDPGIDNLVDICRTQLRHFRHRA
jgi:hypothetical protein